MMQQPKFDFSLRNTVIKQDEIVLMGHKEEEFFAPQCHNYLDECTDMITSEIAISTDKNLLDIDYIHRFLTASYWAEGIPRHAVKKSIDNSFCFGVYLRRRQIGFARVVTDFATFAYLADLFIDEGERGNGYAKALVNAIVNHDELNGLKRWHLLTKDAHELYLPYGFTIPEDPSRHMEKRIQPKY